MPPDNSLRASLSAAARSAALTAAANLAVASASAVGTPSRSPFRRGRQTSPAADRADVATAAQGAVGQRCAQGGPKRAFALSARRTEDDTTGQQRRRREVRADD